MKRAAAGVVDSAAGDGGDHNASRLVVRQGAALDGDAATVVVDGAAVPVVAGTAAKRGAVVGDGAVTDGKGRVGVINSPTTLTGRAVLDGHPGDGHFRDVAAKGRNLEHAVIHGAGAAIDDGRSRPLAQDGQAFADIEVFGPVGGDVAADTQGVGAARQVDGVVAGEDVGVGLLNRGA